MAESVSQRTKFELKSFLPERLAYLSRQTGLLVEAMSGALDLGVKDIFALIALGAVGELTATALGTRCCMHKTRVSRLVSKLSSRGLIQVQASLHDRRMTIIKLTAAGQHLNREYVGKLLELSRHLENAVLPEDRTAFFKSLEKLAVQSSLVG